MSAPMSAPATASAGRLPDFLIVGAAKSGTSTLYQYLRRHPELFMSPVKEPCFFDPYVTWDRGLDWYRALFADAAPDQRCGEASTNYTRYPQVPDVPARIAQVVPEAKLIYIVRHPVDRAYSHYVHRHAKEVFPRRPFDLPFEEFVEIDPLCLDSSDYMLQIERYLEHFPRESLLVLFFDDLTRDPSAVLDEVCRFLGVAPCPELTRERRVANTHAEFQEGTLRARITAPLRRSPLLQSVAYALPQSVRDGVYEVLRRTSYGRGVQASHTPPPMRPDTRRALTARFRPSVEALATFTGRDLERWLR